METVSKKPKNGKKKEDRMSSKLGQAIKAKGYTQKEFAQKVYEETGYFIAVTNLSNYCSGYKKLVKIDTAKNFAQVLDVHINDIL